MCGGGGGSTSEVRCKSWEAGELRGINMQDCALQ